MIRPAASGITCADSLDALGALASGSVDLVYADPPFATGSTRRGRGFAYSDRRRLDEHIAWLADNLREIHRVLAPTGSLFLHLDYRTVHYAKVAADEVFGIERLVNEIVWCYSVGGRSPRAFGRKHDTILWYARGPRYVFDPAAVRVPRRQGSHMRLVSDGGALVQTKRSRAGKVYRYPVAAGKVPEDWWTDIETLNHSDRERTGWPTQKPEALLARLLLAASRPGDLVVDPFCGSGTTGAAAARLGRRFALSDVSPEAVAVARRRLGLGGGP